MLQVEFLSGLPPFAKIPGFRLQRVKECSIPAICDCRLTVEVPCRCLGEKTRGNPHDPSLDLPIIVALLSKMTSS